MFCTKCGAQCRDGGKFCPQCGSALQMEEAAAVSPPDQYQSSMPDRKAGTAYIVLGWIFFAISLLFIPVLFGAGTVIMGYLVRKNNSETHGTIMMILGVAGGILGVILGMAAAGL
ncbi:zinc-ribbon domain-containing protein [Neobacillus sp. NPDC058068]|uniref:zinc-ribbon domain-containing protein n=1 Tax=Neobacillus sp. NPDC058068 TaxID=3346325 RepID=UPI0036DB7A07